MSTLKLQAVQTRFVADVGDLLDLALLDQIDDALDDDLARGGGGDRRHVDAVLALVVLVAGAQADAAASRFVDLLQRLFVVEHLTAADEVGRGQRCSDVVVRIADQRRGGLADLFEVEGADIARHADGDARVGVDEHRREGGGQQRRLLHGVVVVIDEIDGLSVDVAEQLVADGRELRLGVTGGSPRHVAAVEFAEVALGVDIGVQQRLIAARQAHHRVVDRGVAVRVELHGRADDVRGLGAVSLEQSHLVHREQQLAVRGLEAVDLGDGAREDDAHRIGHEVLADGGDDRLLHHLARAVDDAVYLGGRRLGGFLFSRCQRGASSADVEPVDILAAVLDDVVFSRL